MLGLRRAVGTEVVHWLGANKPAYKLDPGFLEHPRLSPRAVIGLADLGYAVEIKPLAATA
jgi:hypothetical protein